MILFSAELGFEESPNYVLMCNECDKKIKNQGKLTRHECIARKSMIVT